MIRILLFFFNTYCLQALAHSPVPEPQKVRLQLKWKHQFQFAGYYAAIEKGFYREKGLEVELKEIQPGKESSDLVLEGEAEFGIGMSDLIWQHHQGKPIVMLAPIFQHSPLILIARSDAGIESVHDLPGHTIMMEASAGELYSYLEMEFVPLDKITILTHPFSSNPLRDKEVAALSAYSTDEPWELRSQGIDHTILDPRSSGVDFYGDTLFTSQKMLQENPVMVKHFLKASLKGWKYALENQEEIVDLIYNRYSKRHSREHLLDEARRTQRLIKNDIVEVGYSNPGRWKHILKTYAHQKTPEQEVSLDSSFFYHRPPPDRARLFRILGILTGIIFLLAIVLIYLYRLNQKIKEASELKGRFVANMSHELRNPMNGIVGMAELLKHSELEDSQRQYAELLHTSALALNRILTDILDFSKLQAHRMQILPASCNLEETLEGVVEFLAAQAQKKGLEIHFFMDPSLPRHYVADAGRIRQIVQNLLSNAIKFTSQGAIVVNVLPEGEALRIEVNDTGVGISQEEQAQLFQPFSQLMHARQHEIEGTGLGLAICRELVEMMGGQIGVTSQEGSGSTFWLTLKLEKETGPASLKSFEKTDLPVFLHLQSKILETILLQKLKAWGFSPKLLDASENLPEKSGILFTDQSQPVSSNLFVLRLVPLIQAAFISQKTSFQTHGYLTVPLCTRALYKQLQRALQENQPPPPETPKTPPVLVVDDNRVNQFYLKNILENAGYSVRCSPSPQDCLKLLKEQEFSMILLDCPLPGTPGIELLQTILSEPRATQIPVFVMTVSEEKEELQALLAAGARNYLIKPLEPQEVLYKLQRLHD